MKSFKEIWPIASLVLNVILIVILLTSGSLFTPSANIGGQAMRQEKEISPELNSYKMQLESILNKKGIDINCMYESEITESCYKNVKNQIQNNDFSESEINQMKQIYNDVINNPNLLYGNSTFSKIVAIIFWVLGIILIVI